MTYCSNLLSRVPAILVISLGLGVGVPAFGSQAKTNSNSAGNSVDSWLMTNKSYDGHRYVTLDQITPGNVAGLKGVCTFDSGVAAPAQSTPVLYEGRIFFSIGQTTAAIDATNCREIWAV